MVVAFGQGIAWWLRRGRWRRFNAPFRGGIDLSNIVHVIWDDPEIGIARPWANLSRYEALERAEMLVWAAYGVFVVIALWDCELCPRWDGDTQLSCQRHSTSALAPAFALACLEHLRAYFAITQPAADGAGRRGPEA